MTIRVVHPALQPYVEAVLPPGEASTTADTYTVLPTPYVVMGVQVRGRVSVGTAAGFELLGRSGVTGLMPAAKRFQAEPATRSVLVVMKPYGAFRLLGHGMSDLADGHPPLDALLPRTEAAELEERVGEAEDPCARVEEFLLRRLARSRHTEHTAVARAVALAVESRGRGPIDSIAREVAVGRRQLERLFRLQVGVTPKEFCSLVRFDWAVRHITSRSSWAALSLDAGFSDQAHFVREFARRAGATPGRFAENLAAG
jgi:AraC-like DNA-binding protein